MNKWTCAGIIVWAITFATAAGAQNNANKMDKMDKMDSMATQMTYSGCLERSPNGSFTLTHVMAADTMKHDQNKGVRKDSMAKDSMAKDAMAKDSMANDSMTPPLVLSSSSVDLKRHVGQKISVVGTEGDKMGDMKMLSVKSLKTIAKSCS